MKSQSFQAKPRVNLLFWIKPQNPHLPSGCSKTRRAPPFRTSAATPPSASASTCRLNSLRAPCRGGRGMQSLQIWWSRSWKMSKSQNSWVRTQERAWHYPLVFNSWGAIQSKNWNLNWHFNWVFNTTHYQKLNWKVNWDFNFSTGLPSWSSLYASFSNEVSLIMYHLVSSCGTFKDG